MRIGVFDSGLGGLTVLRAVRTVLPQADYYYLGDTARTPYGNKSKATIERYSRECARFLLGLGVDILIVACNTASSLALGVLERECPCPVIGTIEPAVASAAQRISSGTIGVIGTRATIASGTYQKRLGEMAPGVQVLAKPCPLFVPLVEEGLFSGELVEKTIVHYLADWRARELSAILLACTHYPLLSAALSQIFDGGVLILDCAQAIAQIVSDMENGKRGGGTVSYYVTDEPSRFSYLTSLMTGEAVTAVHLEEL